MDKTLLLIGGSNIDYIATSDNKIIPSVSNIGEVSISFGGVMRNICENLARLGNKIDFITAIGNDANGKALKNQLIEMGVNVYSPISDFPSGSYVAINDSNHDMINAICDNRIISTLDINYLKSLDELIKKHEYILIDSNVDKTSIDYLFETYPDKKFIVEAISPSKVLKFKDHLNNIFLIKCNIHEAKSLISDELDAKELTISLLNKGIKNVVLSNGSKNIYYGENKDKIGVFKVEEIKEFANTTGCGDALTSGVSDHYIRGYSLLESIAFGNELSKITLMSKGATSKDIEKFRHN